MKCLAVFVSTLLYVHAYRRVQNIDSTSSVSSEEMQMNPQPPISAMFASISKPSSEEISFYPMKLAGAEPQLSLSDLGAVTRPLMQAVKMPNYANDLDSKRALAEVLAPQDVHESDFVGPQKQSKQTEANTGSGRVGGQAEELPLVFEIEENLTNGEQQSKVIQDSKTEQKLPSVWKMFRYVNRSPDNNDYNRYQIL